MEYDHKYDAKVTEVMYPPEGISECTGSEMQRKLCLDGLGCWCEVVDTVTTGDVRLELGFTQEECDISDGGSSSYYDLPPNCDTVQDLIEAYEMDFSRANILKSVIRWEVKPDIAYNLRKIIWYANDKLKRLSE